MRSGAVRIDDEAHLRQLTDGGHELDHCRRGIDDTIVVDRCNVERLPVLAHTHAGDVLVRGKRENRVGLGRDASLAIVGDAVGRIPRGFPGHERILNGPDVALRSSVTVDTAPVHVNQVLVVRRVGRRVPKLGVGRLVAVHQRRLIAAARDGNDGDKDGQYSKTVDVSPHSKNGSFVLVGQSGLGTRVEAAGI
jgi:hypothetical protein